MTPSEKIVKAWFQTDYAQQSGLRGAVDELEEAELVALIDDALADLQRQLQESQRAAGESARVLQCRLVAMEAVVEAARLVGSQYKISLYTNPRKGIATRLLDFVGDDDASDDDRLIAMIDALAALDQAQRPEGETDAGRGGAE